MQKNIYVFNKLKKSLLQDEYNKFIKIIYEYRNQLNVVNAKEESLLHYACYYGLTEKLFTLLDFNVIINKTVDGNSILNYALLNSNDFFIINQLIKLGLQPNELNNYKQPSFFFSSNNIFNHYLKNLFQQKKINIKEYIDINSNNILDFCYITNNFESYHFWKKEFPNITEKKELKKINLNFCK